MAQTIKGIYKNGKVELEKIPEGITESPVFVTFPSAKETTSDKYIYFGMFAGSRAATEQDFQEAEFSEDSLNWL